jgi:hypothetical protein
MMDALPARVRHGVGVEPGSLLARGHRQDISITCGT